MKEVYIAPLAKTEMLSTENVLLSSFDGFDLPIDGFEDP
jgi:hypothetical protein